MLIPAVDVLLYLPESLSHAVLCEWLNLKDIYKVDTAYCQRAGRDVLHELFKSRHFLVTNSQHVEQTFPKAFILWCIKRGLKFSEFYLTQSIASRTDARSMKAFLTISGPTLRIFKCCDDFSPPDWLLHLSEFSTRLERLHWNSFLPRKSGVIAELLQRNKDTLSQLTILFRGGMEAEIDFVLVELELILPHSVSHILTMSPNLTKKLTLHKDVIPVTERNNKLELITLHDVDSECAEQLALFCPSGTALALYFCKDVTSAAFGYVTLLQYATY